MVLMKFLKKAYFAIVASCTILCPVTSCTLTASPWWFLFIARILQNKRNNRTFFTVARILQNERNKRKSNRKFSENLYTHLWYFQLLYFIICWNTLKLLPLTSVCCRQRNQNENLHLDFGILCHLNVCGKSASLWMNFSCVCIWFPGFGLVLKL